MMTPHVPVQRLSPAGVAAVHAYFNVTPEAPGGQRVTWFQFDGEVPGPGRVMVSRPDGSEARAVAAVPEAWGHQGANQRWLSPSELVFSARNAEGRAEAVLLDVDAGTERRFPDACVVTASEATRTVAFSTSAVRAVSAHPDAPLERHEVWLLHVDSGERTLVADEERILPFMPDPLSVRYLREHMRLDHAEISPDGQWVFFQYTPDALRWRDDPGGLLPWFAAELLARSDGSWLQYRGGKAEHLAWLADSSGAHCYEQLPLGRAIRGFSPAQWGKKGHHEHAAVLRPLDRFAAPRIIHTGPGVHGSFSPDARRFVTDSFAPAEPPHTAARLLLFENGETREPRVLAEMIAHDAHWRTGCHPHPTWSRDGQRLYFNADDNEEKRPALYSASVS